MISCSKAMGQCDGTGLPEYSLQSLMPRRSVEEHNNNNRCDHNNEPHPHRHHHHFQHQPSTACAALTPSSSSSSCSSSSSSSFSSTYNTLAVISGENLIGKPFIPCRAAIVAAAVHCC
ncbi:hypothetical protein Ahia01_001352500 [Argonauta hians]